MKKIAADRNYRIAKKAQKSLVSEVATGLADEFNVRFDPSNKPYEQVLDFLEYFGRPATIRDVDWNSPTGRFMLSAWNTSALWDQAESRNLIGPDFRKNLARLGSFTRTKL